MRLSGKVQNWLERVETCYYNTILEPWGGTYSERVVVMLKSHPLGMVSDSLYSKVLRTTGGHFLHCFLLMKQF